MITTLNPLPPTVEKHFMCLLLHEKTPYWDGTYIFDAHQDKYIPHIRHICKECTNEKMARPEE